MQRREFIKKASIAAAGMPLAGACATTYPKTNGPLNVGVIGTGSRGGGLIPLLNEIEEVAVVACCDVLPFQLEKGLRQTTTKVKAYTDYRRLLDNQAIDAVVIATPFSTHAQIALDALEAGKHVYCEKTMAKGLTATKKLVQKATGAKTIFQTGHQYHSSRLYTHVVDLIKRGQIGRIAAIDCQWNRNGNWRRTVTDPAHEKALNWRMYRESSGGLLAELCSHQLDFANWVLDAVPLRVVGEGGVDFWQDGRETYDNIHLIYTYPDGVRAKFTCLTTNSKDDYLIKVLGDKGTITITYDKAWLYPEKKSEYREIGNVDGVSGATVKWEATKGIPIEVAHRDPTKQALLDFRDSIVRGTPPKSDVISGAKAAICVQMGLEALYEGRVVRWKEGLLS
ncbi:MAG: Gfo/Idh/MocA family oxidoreductase [Bacteroidota bacterium]